MSKSLLPDFLQPFACDLKAYERPFIKIMAEPLEAEPLAEKLGVRTSKFLGLPFFPKGKTYPKDQEGAPMLLAAQINFAEVPALEGFPTSGILQLFFSKNRWYTDDVAIFFHEESELAEPCLQDFSFLQEADYAEMPIYKVHRLHFSAEVDPGESEDSQFDYLFGGVSYWDYYEKLGKNQAEKMNAYFNADGHKIGGYAMFTQGDPRAGDPDRENDVQLLQMDSDREIMFGDMGLVHLFIDPAALLAKDFSNAYFYWDCS